jgi:hypothetical protein
LPSQAVLETSDYFCFKIWFSLAVSVILVLKHERFLLFSKVVLVVLSSPGVQVACRFPQIHSLLLGWTLLAGKLIQRGQGDSLGFSATLEKVKRTTIDHLISKQTNRLIF